MSQPVKRPKILFVITQGETGGAQHYVFDLATHLPDFEVVVAMGQERTVLGQRLEQAGVKICYVKNLVRNIRPLRELLAVWELRRLIRKLRPDIIHLNSTKAGVIGNIAAYLAGSPNVIFTAHGFAFLEPRAFVVRRLVFWAEKFASMFRKKIICVSEYDRQAALKYKLCPPVKLITIHNGIDSSNSKYRNIEISSAATIGTIAHDYSTKDLKTLRAAFAILKPEFNNLQLRIIGRGSEAGEVADAAAELANFDIYVCSSIKEGFPYSILEAMAAGLPIASTAVGGIPEAITSGKEGLLVPPRNPRALADAIKKLINNPDLARQLGQNAQKKVQEFTLNKMLSATEQVYQSLITSY